jgi:DNA-3-methyladenine glycosylase II
MWFDSADLQPDWDIAQKHLSKVDPVLRSIIKKVGPCTLHRRRDYFVVLCQSIFSQQISVAVAATLFKRFRNQFPRQRPTPARVIELLTRLQEQNLTGYGLSRQKMAYVLDLARHFETGKLKTRDFARMDDERIIQALTDVKGIGRWTAEMFLIFVLNRPDVYPVDDLGLRKSVQRAYALPEMPTVKQLHQIAEKWKPYRSLATWYLWRMPAPMADTTS